MGANTASRGATIEQLEGVYERRLASLRRLAEAVVGDRDTALDVVQEAFARAVRLRSSFSGHGSLDAWIWRIVLNVARDQATAQSRHEAVVGAVDHETRDATSEAMAHVRTAVTELPERQRLVLFLRYYADLDYGGIAEVLEISAGTVGATLNAAHQRMRQLLEEVA